MNVLVAYRGVESLTLKCIDWIWKDQGSIDWITSTCFESKNCFKKNKHKELIAKEKFLLCTNQDIQEWKYISKEILKIIFDSIQRHKKYRKEAYSNIKHFADEKKNIKM